jgi:hypothetical protein
VIGLDVYNTVSPTRNLCVRSAGPGIAIAFAGDTVATAAVAAGMAAAGMAVVTIAAADMATADMAAAGIAAEGTAGARAGFDGFASFADEILFAASDLPEIRRAAALRAT